MIAALDESERCEEAYAANCVKLRKRLRAIVTQSEVREGLFRFL